MEKRITAEIEARQERAVPLSREDFESRYEELAAIGFPLGEMIRFESDLSQSKQFEYHYELLCKGWRNLPAGQNLDGGGYYKHGCEGMDYLFRQMVFQEQWQEHTAYLIAKNLADMKRSEEYVGYCDRLIPFLVDLTYKGHDEARQKAVIALGWVGTGRELSRLCDILLWDRDALCRSWAATAMMQMSFHRVAKRSVLKQQVITAFYQALSKESGVFAAGCIVLSVQTLLGKKWISGQAVEERNKDKIDQARKTAIRFFYRAFQL